MLRSRHSLFQNESPIWRLSVRSILRRRHELQFMSGETWSLQTPFFSVFFGGTAQDESRLLGRVGRSTEEWFFLVEPGKETMELLTAIAFLHCQRKQKKGSGLESSLLLGAPRAIQRRPYTLVRRREETGLPLVSLLFYCRIEREQDTEQRFELGERKDGGAVA